MKPQLALLIAVAGFAALIAAGATAVLYATPAMAAVPAPSGTVSPESAAYGFVSAALATGLSSLAAGIAVGKLGTAAVGALAEKPELLGRLLILVGLAEGIAIYGLIVSILILNRLA